MNRVDLLCIRHRAVMEEFSRRTVHGLRKSLLFSLIHPLVKDFMDANTAKEIEKDEMVIRRAGAAFREGMPASAIDANTLFEKTKELDGEFLSMVSSLPFSITMPYDELDHIRKERIHLIIDTVFDLLERWDDASSFEDNVAAVFSESRFKDILTRFFSLYNEETRILSGSTSIVLPVKMTSDFFSSRLFDAMEEAARHITDECLRSIFLKEY